ncbi:MAG: hypothetical protein VW239_05690, partial [Candidatus Nanopelagicales bacterium]
PLVRLLPAGLAACLMAPMLWTAPAQAAREVPPDRPDVRRTVTVQVSGEWSGEISFGQIVTGPGRAQRPLPVSMSLTHSGCDLAGCLTTTMTLDESAGVPSAARIASGLSSAALQPSVVGVNVRRSVGGLVLAEHDATLTIAVMAKRSGPVIRRTTWEQGPGGEHFTLSRIAPIRATITMDDATLSGAGELVRTQIVD